MTFEYHRMNPDVTLEEHVKMRRVMLGQTVSSLQRVYLDLRFWILFRDAHRAQEPTDPVFRLLAKLLSLVKEGKAVCPISESTFIELLKQKDRAIRKATAQLIDALSRGVSLIPHPDRVVQELSHALHRHSGIKDLIPLQHLVWTKLPYVIGEMHPTSTPFPSEEERIIQKAFFDHMWDISLVEIIETLGDAAPPNTDWNEIADRLNQGNQKHSAELKSYQKTYRIEFEGSMSVFLRELQQIFARLEDLGYSDPGLGLAGLSETARLKEFSRSIPTLHIGASCHAAVRWDKKRNLTGNDLFDFHHAEAALGYCDVFLTEIPLKNLLEQNHMGLTRNFSCKVFSSAEKALEWFSASEP